MHFSPRCDPGPLNSAVRDMIQSRNVQQSQRAEVYIIDPESLLAVVSQYDSGFIYVTVKNKIQFLYL